MNQDPTNPINPATAAAPSLTPTSSTPVANPAATPGFVQPPVDSSPAPSFSPAPESTPQFTGPVPAPDFSATGVTSMPPVDPAMPPVDSTMPPADPAAQLLGALEDPQTNPPSVAFNDPAGNPDAPTPVSKKPTIDLKKIDPVVLIVVGSLIVIIALVLIIAFVV